MLIGCYDSTKEVRLQWSSVQVTSDLVDFEVNCLVSLVGYHGQSQSQSFDSTLDSLPCRPHQKKRKKIWMTKENFDDWEGVSCGWNVSMAQDLVNEDVSGMPHHFQKQKDNRFQGEFRQDQ